MTLPRTAKAIKELAGENGWRVQETLSNDLLSLRFDRNGTQVVALWHGGRYSSAIVRHPPMKLIQRDLKDLLSTPVQEFGFSEWPPDIKDDMRNNLRWEYEMMDVYISGSPLDYVNYGAYSSVVDVNELEQFGEGEKVQVLGIVEEPVVKKSRRGYWLAFFGVSDKSGFIRCFGFGEEYKQMDAGSVVHVKGVMEERDGDRQIKARVVREVNWHEPR